MQKGLLNDHELWTGPISQILHNIHVQIYTLHNSSPVRAQQYPWVHHF